MVVSSGVKIEMHNVDLSNKLLSSPRLRWLQIPAIYEWQPQAQSGWPTTDMNELCNKRCPSLSAVSPYLQERFISYPVWSYIIETRYTKTSGIYNFYLIFLNRDCYFTEYPALSSSLLHHTYTKKIHTAYGRRNEAINHQCWIRPRRVCELVTSSPPTVQSS